MPRNGHSSVWTWIESTLINKNVTCNMNFNVVFNIFNKTMNFDLVYSSVSNENEILCINDSFELENEINKELERKIKPMEL